MSKSRSQKSAEKITYTPAKVKSPILEGMDNPGGPYTPGAKAKIEKAKRAAKKAQ